MVPSKKDYAWMGGLQEGGRVGDIYGHVLKVFMLLTKRPQNDPVVNTLIPEMTRQNTVVMPNSEMWMEMARLIRKIKCILVIFIRHGMAWIYQFIQFSRINFFCSF